MIFAPSVIASSWPVCLASPKFGHRYAIQMGIISSPCCPCSGPLALPLVTPVSHVYAVMRWSSWKITSTYTLRMTV
jgi:hypothetical protein